MDDHAQWPAMAAPEETAGGLKHRNFEASDALVVCSFARTAEELFLFIPPATFPLTPEQLLTVTAVRKCATVILHNHEVVGYANLYDVVPGEYCFTGNVIVDPERRGMGLGRYLLDTMEARAVAEFGVREHRIACMANNPRALLWYARRGYKPYAVTPRTDPHGQMVAMISMARSLETITGLPDREGET